MKTSHFFRRNFGLRSGISDFGICASGRSRSMNFRIPFGRFGFFASMLMLLLQTHESCAINTAECAPRQTTTGDARQHVREAVGVVYLSRVEPKDLFIDVALKVEGRDRNVSAFDRSLEQRPEVFDAVRVNQTAHVFGRVIDGFVLVSHPQISVTLVGIGVDVRAGRDVMPDAARERERIRYFRPSLRESLRRVPATPERIACRPRHVP